MADEKITALLDSDIIMDSDILVRVKNVGTTPVTKSQPWSAYKNTIGAGSWDGKIVPSVTSNDLTVALKGMDGNDPSPSNQVHVRIGDTLHTIEAALSVTVADATNWFNAGGAELATLEIDYFVYLGYNATDGVVIGFSRIPYANEYDDFSATSTNEKYAAISTITNAAAGDDYVLIGRFAATLSAGAGYTWTVPTFTSKNLIQRPIYETQWRTWAPTYGGFSSAPATHVSRYKIVGRDLWFYEREATNGTSNATTLTLTLPFAALTLSNADWQGTAQSVDNNVTQPSMCQLRVLSGSSTLEAYKDASGAAWTNSGNKRVVKSTIMVYPIG